MTVFTVDQEKCNKDGICAAECPMKIIEIKDGLPVPVNGADMMCINCGHCVAVCPTAALTHRDLKPEDCLEVNKEWLLGPEQAEHFLRNRRSIRNYKSKPVDRPTLEKVINVASHAPTGHNFQPVTWQVIYERDEVKRLSGMVIDWMKYMIREQPDMAKMMHLDLVVAGWQFGMDTVSRDAPHLVLVNAKKSDVTAKDACVIAMTHLELALPSFGLGGCWNGFFNVAAMFWPPLQKELNLKEGYGNNGVMMVGFPKFRYPRMPKRNEAKITWS